MRRVSALLLLIASLAHADEIAQSRLLQREALGAYKSSDAKLFLEKMAHASTLRPNHPTMLYQLAVANALNGRNDDALALLERVAAMGFVYTPEEEKEFASFLTDPRFTKIVSRFRDNGNAKGAPRKAFSLDESGLIGEGLAYHRASDRFFVSSVRKGAIYSIDSRRRAKPFLQTKWGVFGMTVDSSRNILWAATSALPQSENFTESDRGKAALLKIDLRSGKLLETLMPSDEGKHLFGDVALGRNGEVFVSDGSSATIYRVDGARLVPFVTGPFASLQGLTFDASGRILYASDYSRGIYAIDMATKDMHLMTTPADTSLLGIDGIYLAKPGVLIATQNGTNPYRIIRISLERSGLAVASARTLAANNPLLADPTLGVVTPSGFHFIANAQWDVWDDAGKVKEGAKLLPLVVLRAQL